jgi:hypothetical protein
VIDLGRGNWFARIDYPNWALKYVGFPRKYTKAAEPSKPGNYILGSLLSSDIKNSCPPLISYTETQNILELKDVVISSNLGDWVNLTYIENIPKFLTCPKLGICLTYCCS